MTLQPFTRDRQPARTAWSRDRLFRERAIALGHSIELSTVHAYNSHLQSYLSFCKIHDFPIEPTPDTLSFFVVFMSHYIKPSSVATYLSGICNCLEPHFPDVRSVRNSPVVTRSLAGMKKLRGFSVPLQKRALSVDDISSLLNAHHSGSHDDLLFLSMLLTGFSALLRLGEMTVSNSPAKRSSKKITLRHTLSLQHDHYSFQLPFHKADRLYQGNKIIVLSKPASPRDPLPFMRRYMLSRDTSFPFHPELWLTSAGFTPTSSWFTSRLRSTLGPDVGGHSIRSGAATTLALEGVPDNLIQGMGRWSSDAFKVYIRKHPVVLHALIHGPPACNPLL
jgi:hypothetical protein